MTGPAEGGSAGGGGNAPTVSVVVPVYNAVGTVERTLRALARQTIDQPFEVIVVDGGSEDGTLEVLARASRLGASAAEITVLHNPEREPASSRNLGVRHARSDRLAFTDGDCEPEPEWLVNGLRALARADIVQGQILPVGGHGPFDRTLGVVGEYGLYETANLLLGRRVFERTGGFEPIPGLELPDGTHFGEDAWFVWRARRLGARTTFAPDAIVRHAVVHRGRRAWTREVMRRRYFPALAALIPELRDTYLHHRIFLSPISQRFDLAVAGLSGAVITRRPLTLAALAPYALAVREEVRGRPRDQRRAALQARLAGDALTLLALLQGSIRARTLVI